MPTLPFQINVSSKYGAPMGRRSDSPHDFVGKVHLRYVPFVDHDYDQGGAYWGGSPANLWCLFDNEGHAIYERGPDRESVKAMFPGLKFYR